MDQSLDPRLAGHRARILGQDPEGKDYVFVDDPEGRTLVVTGPWKEEIAGLLRAGEVDGLRLNYALGFLGSDLEFLEDWGLRRLYLLDRGIVDLEPLSRLGSTLERLSIQAAPRAELDLAALPRVCIVGAEWGLLRATLGALTELEQVVTWRFSEPDLHAFRDHVGLEKLVVKDSQLVSLEGIEDLSELSILNISLAPPLADISAVRELGHSLRDFDLQGAPRINDLDDVQPLVGLRVLVFGDCRSVASLRPIEALRELELFHGWGTTRVLDDDLSPLARLPRLKEIRMRHRASYKPSVPDLQAALEARSKTS